MKPKVSLIGPAHRTELWRTFYESIITNLDFEVVFVTDKEPKIEEIEALNNLKWIFSQTKPAQCNEIAYRNSTGDFIIFTADDILYSPYAIDNAYNMYKTFYDDRIIIVIRFFEDGKEATHFHRFPENDKVQLACAALISKKAVQEAGGLADINFVSGHWDGDLIMRIREKGGRIFTCPLACAYEPHLDFHKIEQNFALDWENERNYLISIWDINIELYDNKDIKNIKVKRKVPFEPFSAENLLSKTQGNKGISGKWI